MRLLILMAVVLLVGCAGTESPDDAETPAQVLARLELPTMVLDSEERIWLEGRLQKFDSGKNLFNYGHGRHTAWVRELKADGEWAGRGSGGITSYPHAASLEWVVSKAYQRCESRKQAKSQCLVLWLDGWIED